MDNEALKWATTIGVPTIIYVLAEYVKRNSAIGQVRIDDNRKFLGQIQDALDKALERAERCESERRRQDRRIAVLEYVVRNVSAEASIVAQLAEELAILFGEPEPPKPEQVVTEARRLSFTATKLKQLARRVEDDDPDIPMSGIGAREE